MKFVAILTATVAVAAPAFAVPADKPKDKGKDAPVVLTLSADKEKYKPGDTVVFELTVNNNTDKPLTLNVEPAKFLNNGLHALLTGEMLRRVEAKKGEPALHAPGTVSFGGIEPGVLVKEKEITIEAKGKKSFAFVAVIDSANPVRLLFDDPNSPGLKTFGRRLSRSAYVFPLAEGRNTFRFVLERGGTSAASNDVTIELAK